jgi:hypothetical protein
MPIPNSEDGVFEGALLFDGRGYREPSEIVDFSYSSGRLGLVKDKRDHFVAEFLIKHESPQFSLPVWDAIRESCICGSHAEAKALTDKFVTPNDNDDA